MRQRYVAGAGLWRCAAALLAAAASAAAPEHAAPPLHEHAAAAVASWHPHRFRDAAGGHAAPDAPLEEEAVPQSALPAAGTRKPRVGVAPPGVELEAALASAQKLQPEFFGALPDEFLADYKNPCWHPANATAGTLRCLPYYYILGDFQCGVRDLASRVLKHPDVLPSGNSAPHWWDEDKAWNSYWPLYDGAARAVVDAPQRIVGDTSTATFAFTWTGSGRTNKPWSKAMMHCREETCKQDMTCITARCYEDASAAWHPVRGDGSSLDTPHLMRLAMGANIRLIVLLRDPVERLHAAFWAHDHYRSKYGASEAGFEAFVDYSLESFEACASKHTRDGCVLALEAWGQEQEDVFYHCDQLLKGAYSVYMRSWLHAFPAGELLVLRLEDYARPGGVQAALDAVQRHLGLAAPDAAAAAAMATAEIARASSPRSRFPERVPPERIAPAVRAKLRAFYDPFDTELEELMGKTAFADWHGKDSFIA